MTGKNSRGWRRSGGAGAAMRGSGGKASPTRLLCPLNGMAAVSPHHAPHGGGALLVSAARRGGCSPRRGTHGPAPTRRWVARAVGAGAATRGQAASQPGCRGGECVLCGVGERLALGSEGWVGAGSAGRLPPPRVQSEPTGAPRRGGVSRDRVEGGEPWGRSSRRRARGWTAWGDGAARRVRGDGGGGGPAGRSGDGRLLRGGCKVEGPRAVKGGARRGHRGLPRLARRRAATELRFLTDLRCHGGFADGSNLSTGAPPWGGGGGGARASGAGEVANEDAPGRDQTHSRTTPSVRQQQPAGPLRPVSHNRTSWEGDKESPHSHERHQYTLAY